MSTIKELYEFTLAQYGAESYLDNEFDQNFDIYNQAHVKERLKLGANHYHYTAQNAEDNNLSATQMTDVMVNDFLGTWEIINHQENTSSGFSATLMKHKQRDEYTLSFRSTESKLQEDGGDAERDNFNGANGQVRNIGFAYGQILDMEKYYQELKDNGDIPENAKINVTGYSLGGAFSTGFYVASS